MTRWLIFAAVWALVTAAPAEASCVLATEREHLRRADAVFVGRALWVGPAHRRATFKVLRIRKGALRRGSSVRVISPTYPSSITFNWPPRVGERWRVYAKRESGRWTTNDCMGTRRV